MLSSNEDNSNWSEQKIGIRWLFFLAGLAIVGAAGLWIAHKLWGPSLVNIIYLGQTPLDWLNGLINRQDVHPLQYYQNKADRAVFGAILVVLAAPLLMGGWLAAARRWPASTWNNSLVGGGLVATSLWALAYGFEVPVFQVLPHWFWALSSKQLPWWWLLPLLAVLSWVVLRAVLRTPQRTGVNLLLLAVLGFCLQHGFALTEGRGLSTMRDCLLKTGHADFAHQALIIEDPVRLVDRYDSFLDRGELPFFPHATKPPGALLFFCAFARAGKALMGPTDLVRLATWAAWLFPLGACAVLVPLFFIARLAMPLPQAWVGTSLFLFVPSTVLISLHADQFLYPLIGLVFIYCVVRAMIKAGAWWGLSAGVAFYLATFVSFALAALAPLIPVLGAAAILGPGGWNRWLCTGWTAACTIIGFLVAYGLMYAVFGYNGLDRFQQALAAHQAWKVEAWSGGMRLYFAVLNLIEFALWCGIPVALLAAADLWRSMRHWSGWTVGLGLSRGLLLILVFLGVVGKTAAESGRLWLFLVPLVLVAAGRHLHRLSGKQVGRAAMVLALLQFFSIVVLKTRQDFLQ